MAAELNYNVRVGDYEFKAVPKHLVRLNPDEKNETIDFCKWDKTKDDKDYKYSIAYFVKGEEGWDLSLVGNRFFENVPEKEYLMVMKILKNCLATLNDFSTGKE